MSLIWIIYVTADKGLNDQMNSKKQEALKSDRMKEMKWMSGVVLLSHFASCMTFAFVAFVPGRPSDEKIVQFSFSQLSH